MKHLFVGAGDYHINQTIILCLTVNFSVYCLDKRIIFTPITLDALGMDAEALYAIHLAAIRYIQPITA
jgi:hypothetical protein